MNYQQPELDSAFADMVTREHKNQATPEEIEYLKEHIQEWRTELLNRLNRTKGHIVNLEGDLSEDTLHEKRFELERRITHAKTYMNAIQRTLARVKSYKQETTTKPQNVTLVQKTAFCRGWKHAIHTFHELIEGGLTSEQAHRTCLNYLGQELTRWKHDTEMDYIKDEPSLVSRKWEQLDANKPA